MIVIKDKDESIISLFQMGEQRTISLLMTLMIFSVFSRVLTGMSCPREETLSVLIRFEFSLLGQSSHVIGMG